MMLSKNKVRAFLWPWSSLFWNLIFSAIFFVDSSWLIFFPCLFPPDLCFFFVRDFNMWFPYSVYIFFSLFESLWFISFLVCLLTSIFFQAWFDFSFLFSLGHRCISIPFPLIAYPKTFSTCWYFIWVPVESNVYS